MIYELDLCKTVNSPSPMFPGNFGVALSMVDSNNDGLIDFDEFIDLDKRYPLLLFPAFRLQQQMQKITLGEMNWIRINESIAKASFLQDYMNDHGGFQPYSSIRSIITGKILDVFGFTFCVSLTDIEKLKQCANYSNLIRK